MKIFSQDLFQTIVDTKSMTVRFTLNAYYLDTQGRQQTDGITITLTADGYTQVNNYIDVPIGTDVTYTVTKQDYNTEGPKTVCVTGETTLDVKITALPLWTYNIVTVPDDATVSMNGQVEQSKSITVPQGNTVTWAISRNSMNSLSGSRQVPASSADTNPITETKILTSTITLLGVTPNDASVTWTTGTGDVSHDMSVTALCTNTVGLVISKAGYNSHTASYPLSGDYLLNTEIQAITLTKKTLTCTLACNTPDAIISLKIGENGVPVTGTNSVTINCVMDDVVYWSVTKENYYPRSGQVTMQTTDVVLDPVTLVINNYVVTVTANPSNADVRILSNGTILASGEGGASVGVSANTAITYDATLGGVTVSRNATITADFTDEIVLDAVGAVTLVTAAQSSTILPYGKYKCILVGAGAGGHAPARSAYTATRTGTGSSGGGGGGSGYATIGNFLVTSKQGMSVIFNVGQGGAAGSNGGDTSVIAGNITLTASGGKAGYSSSTTAYYGYGGDGGSGGGAGGSGGQNVSTGGGVGGSPNSDGANGAYAGGNGGSVTWSNYGGTVTTTTPGGTGYYATTKSYENNYGAKSTTGSGTAGAGGRGLSVIEASIRTASTFINTTNVQTLYNSLGGGGGGGGSYTPAPGASIPSNIYGGAGGGGGGWAAGTAGSGNTPGTGGNGAILYMRIAWS